MKTRVALTYDGNALKEGRMGVHEVAKNIVAFSEFMTVAARSAYGDKVEATAEVAGFKEGSFETDFVLSVVGPATTLLSTLSPSHFWDVIKSAFDLWRFLRGEPPASVAYNPNHVAVTNNYGEVNQFHVESLTIVMSPQGAEAVEKFVREPLRRSGVTSMKLRPREAKMSVQVTNDESEFFTAVAREDVLSDNLVPMVVQVVGPEFEGGRKWRFTAGESSFTADIEDQDFLGKVNAGERFGKGDALEVEMRVVQFGKNRALRVERSIVRVLRHIVPQEQLSFP